MSDTAFSHQCAGCNRIDVVLFWHPALRLHYCLPCMRDKQPKFWESVRHWAITNGNFKNGTEAAKQ